MLCTVCQVPITIGVDAFQKEWTENEKLEKLVQSHVCLRCLVGWNIPVFRSQTKSWEFGVVEEFSDETKQHLLRFIDDMTEWVIVETNAFEKYIEHCRISLSSGDFIGDEGHTNYHEMKAPAADSLSNAKYTFAFEFGSHAPNLQMSPCGVRQKKVPDEIHPLPIDGKLSCQILEVSDFYHSPSPATTEKNMVVKESRNDSEFTYPNGNGDSRKIITSPEGYRSNIATGGRRRDEINGTPTNGNNFSTSQQTETLMLVDGTHDPASKHLQKMWSPQEDKTLLETVAANSYQFKWPQIAKTIPGRTGKQCRERYMNHLKPTLKLANWCPWEDALIFHLYFTQGSKWAMMSKVIRGRTDNGIKNRFHHLKRRFEKRVQGITPGSLLDDDKSVDKNGVSSLIKELKECRVVPYGDFGDLLLEYASYQVRSKNRSRIEGEQAAFFGPWRLAKSENCRRCGLIAPSAHTGRFLCQTSGWCETCSRVSPCLNGDILRKVQVGVTMTTTGENAYVGMPKRT